MKGDFSRFGFDITRHYSRVLHQQGRVALDADSNEAAAVLLHHLRTLTRDLYGTGGGPPDSGFSLHVDNTHQYAALSLGPGHYYVGGILCENEQWTAYADQPDFTPSLVSDDEIGDALLAWLRRPSASQAFCVYLDVWERHVSWIEDDSIREPALGGADTCSRAQVVWQAKAMLWDERRWGRPRAAGSCTTALTALLGPGAGASRMAARASPSPGSENPMAASGYYGGGDRLYRVEIHRPGRASNPEGASFKWSRENGSVAARWLGADEQDGALTLRLSSTRGFAAGDWAELSHDMLERAGAPGQLVQLSSVANQDVTIDAQSVPGGRLMAWCGHHHSAAEAPVQCNGGIVFARGKVSD